MNTLKAKPQPLPGVIDSLATGFESINRIAWIVLFPIALDLFLWKGPQLSIAPFVRRVLAWYSAAATAQLERSANSSMPAEALQSMEQFRQMLEASTESVNLFGFLGGGGPLIGMMPVVPSLAMLGSTGPVTEVAQPILILAFSVGIGLLAILLGCVYLAMVAQQVRDGRIDFVRLGRSVWKYWLSALAFVAVMLGLSIFVGLPAGLFVSAAFLISPTIGLVLSSLAAILVQMGAMLMLLYFFFIADAIVVSEVGPFRAVANSARVVARNFWSVMALIVLIFVISIGTQEIWRYVAAEPWGALAGIAGNAYIASGLIAARMLYYRNRVAAVEEARALARGRGNR